CAGSKRRVSWRASGAKRKNAPSASTASRKKAQKCSRSCLTSGGRSTRRSTQSFRSMTMELVERYLQAVRFFLTGKDQADILQELAENLASEIEEREATLGRRRTDAETADILRRHGHPLVVASRYRSTTHLIGPVLLPIYVLALKMGLAAALIATVAGAAIGSVVYGNPTWRVVDAMLTFPGRALMVFAWTTVGFVGLDFALKRVRSVPQWDPRTLPKLMKRGRDIPRGRTLFELCLLTIAVVW